MKSNFFPKKDEIVLSTLTAAIVLGLLHQACVALFNGKEHAVFQRSHVVMPKK